MKFTLPWLREHLETDADLATITETLTRLGLEVDTVDDPEDLLGDFIIAHVTDRVQHPDADRLSLCTVDIGADKPVSVVCGAPNVRKDMKAVYAPIGTTIPANGMLLKKAKIRGVESFGMLCSERELGLGEDHDGIMDVATDLAPGETALPVLGIEGPVIDIDLTPNRADCFGISGIARDLAAAGLGRLKSRAPVQVPSAYRIDMTITRDFGSDAANDEACPLFMLRPIRNVKNGPSPEWLQRRLKAIGLRPISALVDITNYFTYDLCRPLHVFDADKVQGDITLRYSTPGEEFLALDGKSYTLNDRTITINDANHVISLGGIMGGEESGCTETTTNVYLEVARFSAASVMGAGRHYGIVSDARTRFERGLDQALMPDATEWATQMILDLCGGEAGETVMVGRYAETKDSFRFDPALVTRIAGISPERDQITGILQALGCLCEDDGTAFTVTAPGWRADLATDYDLVEEIARIIGYDNIPSVSVLPDRIADQAGLNPTQQRVSGVRRMMASLGYAEAITWSFMDRDIADLFGGSPVALQNPISSDLAVMRPSLLANLSTAALRNLNQGTSRGAICELGPRFTDAQGTQELVAAGVRFGTKLPASWQAASASVDFYDVRRDVMSLLEAAGIPTARLQWDRDTSTHYHPGQSARVKLGPKVILAELGMLHPHVLTTLDIDAPVAGFELFLDRLPAIKTKAGKARAKLQLSTLQPVDRDFAFIIPEETDAGALLHAIGGADKKLITGVRLFDVYRGKGVEDGHKSLAVAVTLQPTDATLTDDDLKKVSDAIVAAAAKATGAVLRG